MQGRETSPIEIVLLALGALVFIVWSTVVLIQGIFPDHPVPREVHGVMVVLVPLLFGGAHWASKQNGKKPPPPKDDQQP